MRRKYPGRPYRTATVGNSLTEYGIIGLIVLGLSWLALSNMGDFVSTLFKNMLGEKPSSTAQVAAPPSSGAGINTPDALTNNLNDGSLLEIGLSKRLQTLGANGATSTLANELIRVAEEALATEKINQEQYDILIQLANQGHRMADIQFMIENAIELSNGNYNEFSSSEVTWDGSTYTVLELSKMLGHDGAPNDYTSGGNMLEDLSSMKNSAVDPELAAFINLYKQALDSGALSDPLVSSTVESAATQITSIGEIVQHSIYEFSKGDVNTVSEFKDNQVSIATDMESSNICKAGDYDDSGVYCSPKN